MTERVNMKLGETVERSAVFGRATRYVVTGKIRDLDSGGVYYALTPLPDGKTAMDIGRGLEPALVERGANE